MKNFFERHILFVTAVCITALYIPLTIGMDAALPRGIIPAFIGMFVPFGIWNTLFTHGIGLVVYLLLLLLTDHALSKSLMSPIRKFIIALIFLFVMTFIADMLIWHVWNSGSFFFNNFGFNLPINTGSSM